MYQGWQTYYEMFHQLVVKSKFTLWSQLNGTLYVTTFLSQQKSESVTCQTCSSPDHHTFQCAFAERKVGYILYIGTGYPLHHERNSKLLRSPGYAMHGIMESSVEGTHASKNSFASSAVESANSFSVQHTRKSELLYTRCHGCKARACQRPAHDLTTVRIYCRPLTSHPRLY